MYEQALPNHFAGPLRRIEEKIMRTSNAPKTRVIIALIAFVAMAASTMLAGMPASAQKASKKPATSTLNAPTLTCGTSSSTSIEIQVCAGPSGAAAGFSVQWMTKADYDALGGNWPTSSESPNPEAESFCKASFSGVPGCSNYNLTGDGEGKCVTVQIGDNLFDDCGASSSCANQPLECDTEYVFRAFAHNVPQGANKSDWSNTLTCTTLPCGGGNQGCTFTQGYWKTHGPIPTGNNSNEWPVTELTLGTVNYTDLELQAIFDTPAGGNGLIALAHQLIAAKLNIANGADGTLVAAAIAAADALIGGLVIPPVGSGSLSPASTSSLTATLDSFNNGLIGPGHCE